MPDLPLAAGPLGALHEGSMVAFGALVLVIEAVCVLVLVIGVVSGFMRFLSMGAARRASRAEWLGLRRHVGMYLLLALELLVASDIIETMIRPTFEQLAILAGISAIRIATGAALGRELRGSDEPAGVAA